MEAGSTLKDVSESLLIVNSEDDEDDQKRNNAARYLFNAVNNVFEATVQNGTGDLCAPETVQVSAFPLQDTGGIKWLCLVTRWVL